MIKITAMDKKHPMSIFRDKHQLTQGQLGKMLEVGQSAVSQYEGWSRRPEIAVTKKFNKLELSYGDKPSSIDDLYPDEEAA